MVESCKICKFGKDNGFGIICRRLPPVYQHVINRSAFPINDQDQWCGEFRPRIALKQQNPSESILDGRPDVRKYPLYTMARVLAHEQGHCQGYEKCLGCVMDEQLKASK